MSAIKIPNNIKYWINKGKTGKDVFIHTHNDLDGIYSAIVIKKYLINKGFNIIGYNILTYEDKWNVVEINTNLINIAVDFSEYNSNIDIYIDHHGDITEEIKNKNAIKTKTGSAYEGIMNQLNLPIDSIILSIIDMIDAAKYNEYSVKWTDLLDYNLSEIIKKPNAKLIFAGNINQMIKRSDHRTIIEVIHNSTEPNIYQIFNLFKILYPFNNKNYKNGNEMHFLNDSLDRLDKMKTRTRGNSEYKYVIKSQKEFYDNYLITECDKYGNEYKRIKLDGYCVIGELVFLGSGTWSNPIRARSIIESDIESGRLKLNGTKIKWIMLQYGDSLQIVSFQNIKSYTINELPKTKEGEPINDLNKYTSGLLDKFKQILSFYNPYTLAGGHSGIGNISSIGVQKFNGNKELYYFANLRYLDLFINYIIANLSNVNWKLDCKWENPIKNDNTDEPTPINARIMYLNQIRKVNNINKEITFPDNYKITYSVNEYKKIINN
jgi:ribosomal 50S subunit-recycling heat shock protein